MWLSLKNKKTKEEMLILIRYTFNASNVLFPSIGVDEWEKLNCPDDASQFIKGSLARTQISNGNKNHQALIATVDDEYLNWLAKNRYQHSLKILTEYLKDRVENIDFWNQRLIDSKMTAAYNVLGIPCLVILHNCQEMRTNYHLSKELICKITSVLQDVYDTEKVFVPGWFVKGCDAPMCIKDIIQSADVFWKSENRIRVGKFLEQQYACEEIADRFTPIYFVIPFVIKTNIEHSVIDLRGLDAHQNARTAQSMTHISFQEEYRRKLFNIITQTMPYVISIGPNAVLPNQAYIAYHGRIITKHLESSKTSNY
jgi:hypothetical protein